VLPTLSQYCAWDIPTSTVCEIKQNFCYCTKLSGLPLELESGIILQTCTLVRQPMGQGQIQECGDIFGQMWPHNLGAQHSIKHLFLKKHQTSKCSYRSWWPSHQMVALRRNKLHDWHSMCHVIVCQITQQSIWRRHHGIADVGVKLSFVQKLNVIDTFSWIVWNVLCCPVEIAS